MISSSLQEKFSLPLLRWFDQHGRNDLPWQNPRDAYRVWISEIMLQQTQVKTVIPYFIRFMDSFPNVETLAHASVDDVLALWSGLGYYQRARNLHKTAKIIVDDFKSEFPDELHQWQNLPGIGASTAAAITAQTFDAPHPILDGNVKRVFSRYFRIEGFVNQAKTEQQLWQCAHACMPQQRCRDYTQAIMDLGATCCTPKNPQCRDCPVQMTCQAKIHNEVANYPNKRPAKKLPNKYQYFLVLHTLDHYIYLEKRPPTGIWGGLWCLPSIELDDDPVRYIEKEYQLKTTNGTELVSFKHTFSHFHLHIQALCLTVHPDKKTLHEYAGQWFSIAETKALGLPKPVNNIIRRYQQTSIYKKLVMI